MTWALAFVIVAAIAALVAALHVVLPYVVKRSDAETKVAALEAANVELRDRLTRVEQFLEGGGPLGKLRSMSR